MSTSSTSSLQGLPYEIRELILQPILQTGRLLETQAPLYSGKSLFVQPIMQTCRQLRLESLEIFYRVNKFRFDLDVQNHARTDPTNCAAIEALYHGIVATGPLPSAIPWKYGMLMEHVRHVQVHINLPRLGERKDRDAFPHRLRMLITALDYGRRLQDLMLYIWTNDHTSALNESEARGLAVLCEIRLPGTLRLKVHPLSFKKTIDALELEERIKYARLQRETAALTTPSFARSW